jgi:hypothetical protein
MEIEQLRAKIMASVWQSIAVSDVDLSSVPLEKRQKLVNNLADEMLKLVDTLLDEIPKPVQAEAAEASPYDEEKLWEGRPFLSLVESYLVTSERIKVTHGLLSRDIENFELVRVQDIDLSRNLGERMIGLGDILIKGKDPSDPELTLRNIKDPEQLYELLRKAWLAARKRHGLQFRDYV